MECYFEGCGEPVRSRGLCNAHRQQDQKGQELRPVLRTLEERAWAKVKKAGEYECWEWTGARTWANTSNTEWYGVLRVQGKPRPAHRVIYELAKGEIPAGLEVDHQCRNKLCVNPRHLKVVTRIENRQNVGPFKNNTSGFRGVSSLASGRFLAQIYMSNRTVRVGVFDTAEEANAAVVEARREKYTNSSEHINLQPELPVYHEETR